jgi:penicillin-binding protein 1C
MSEDEAHTPSSWPGLTRPSTSSSAEGKVVDARVKPGHDERGKGRTVRIVAVLGLICLGLVGSFAAWVFSLGPPPLAEARRVSTTIIDRNGKLLRAYAMADGRWRLPVDAARDVDPTYLNLLLAFEDRRFRQHRLRRLDHHDAARTVDGRAEPSPFLLR